MQSNQNHYSFHQHHHFLIVEMIMIRTMIAITTSIIAIILSICFRGPWLLLNFSSFTSRKRKVRVSADTGTCTCTCTWRRNNLSAWMLLIYCPLIYIRCYFLFEVGHDDFSFCIQFRYISNCCTPTRKCCKMLLQKFINDNAQMQSNSLLSCHP